MGQLTFNSLKEIQKARIDLLQFIFEGNEYKLLVYESTNNTQYFYDEKNRHVIERKIVEQDKHSLNPDVKAYYTMKYVNG